MARQFKKAAPEQAYLKVGWYGSQGTGKTLTELLVGEWLIEQENAKFAADPKNDEVEPPYRMVYIDTERGTDFYARHVPERKVHPEAFDFDREVTRSVYELKDIMKDLRNDPGRYKLVIIDSMTHFWEAAKESYAGKRMANGEIPITGWGQVKKPVKMINESGLNGAFHWFFAGREGLVYEKDEDTGEEGVTGYRMKAEGEQPYEPHLLIQMYKHRSTETKEEQIRAYVEKDRSGCLQGQSIIWPKGDFLARAYELLSGDQGTFTTAEDASAIDVRKQYEEQESKDSDSVLTYEMIREAILKAKTKKELAAAWDLTKFKKKLLGSRFDQLSALMDGRVSELIEEQAIKQKAETGTPEKVAERALIGTKEN